MSCWTHDILCDEATYQAAEKWIYPLVSAAHNHHRTQNVSLPAMLEVKAFGGIPCTEADSC